MTDYEGINPDKPLETYTASDVRRLLPITHTERTQTGPTVDKVAEALRQTFHPQQVYLGGSYKKHTCLRGSYDVDLVIFIHDFDPDSMEQYKDAARRGLTFHNVIFNEGRRTPYCIKIDVNTGFVEKPLLHFDLQFTGDPARRKPGAHERFYSAAGSQSNDEVVSAALQCNKGLRELILLSKLWRSRQSWTQFGVTSFYVELVCIAAITAQTSIDIQTGFRAVLELLRQCPEMCKVGGVVKIPQLAKEECQRFVAATLEAVQPLYVYKPPRDIRFSQKSVGCKFRNGCTLEDTALQLIRADIQKRDIEMIRITLHDDGNYYTLDNRRLAVFRLLEFSGKTQIVKARVLPKPSKEWAFKYDTTSDGLVAAVRGTAYSIGATEALTSFPFQELLATVNTSEHLQVPEMDSDSDDEHDLALSSNDGLTSRFLADAKAELSNAVLDHVKTELLFNLGGMQNQLEIAVDSSSSVLHAVTDAQQSMKRDAEGVLKAMASGLRSSEHAFSRYGAAIHQRRNRALQVAISNADQFTYFESSTLGDLQRSSYRQSFSTTVTKNLVTGILKSFLSGRGHLVDDYVVHDDRLQNLYCASGYPGNRNVIEQKRVVIDSAKQKFHKSLTGLIQAMIGEQPVVRQDQSKYAVFVV